MYVPPVGSTTAVDVRDSSSMRTKSLRIASAVSSSTIRVPGAAAGETGGDDGHAEPLQRAGDVDPLAACERQPGARAVPLAQLEVRHGQRAVDRGVEGDGDDHEIQLQSVVRSVRPRTSPCAPSKPGFPIEREATSGRRPISRCPA